jgi:L-serine dehydratase
MYQSLHDAIRDASSHGIPLSSIALDADSREQGLPVAEIQEALGRAVILLRSAISQGVRGRQVPASGILSGDAALLRKSVAGPLHRTAFNDVMTRALAVHELNATVGGIAGIPKGSDAGIVPAVLTGLADARGIPDEQVADALATAALIGAIITERSSRSRDANDVRTERGVAISMAAGAATEMLGGTPEQVGHAVALAQQGILGLGCDPLGSTVELTCACQNATGAAIAMAAVEMALAGITFAIPADEVTDVIAEIGDSIDARFRATTGGAIGATPTGKRLTGDGSTSPKEN